MTTQTTAADAHTSDSATAGGMRLLAAVLVPLLLLAALRLVPRLDVAWQNHPAHFWLVLGAAATAAAIGYAVTTAARRRLDARLVLIGLAMLSGAGFLGLHALATPGVLVGPNAGFEMATPIGLVLGALVVGTSVRDLDAAASRRVLESSRGLLVGLVALMLVWAVVSLLELPPLDAPLTEGVLQTSQIVLAAVGAVGYGIGAWGYLRLYRRRGAKLVLAVSVAFGLLAAALVVIAFAANWRVSWWEWHLLMLVAFGVVAASARAEWHQERFSSLYLEQTLGGAREVSVMFADLEGFTPYTERTDPTDVRTMLNTYFSRLVPLLEDAGGEVHQLIGDAVMVVFNKHGHQDDHEVLAARAAVAFQAAATDIARQHPEWPRFRVGVNSGSVVTGVLGARGHRTHGVVGDTVNLAARLESQASAGGIVIGQGTFEALPDETLVERLPSLQLKGKAEPVTAYVLRDLPMAR